MATSQMVDLIGTGIVKMAELLIGCPNNLIRTFSGAPKPRQITYDLLRTEASMGPLLLVSKNVAAQRVVEQNGLIPLLVYRAFSMLEHPGSSEIHVARVDPSGLKITSLLFGTLLLDALKIVVLSSPARTVRFVTAARRGLAVVRLSCLDTKKRVCTKIRQHIAKNLLV